LKPDGSCDGRIYVQLNDGRRYLIWVGTSGQWTFAMAGARLGWAGVDDIMKQDDESTITQDHAQYLADLGTATMLRLAECEYCSACVFMVDDYIAWDTNKEGSESLTIHMSRIKPEAFQPPGGSPTS
jgi:hypothetical protein